MCARPVTDGLIRHTGPKHIWQLAKLPPKNKNFLFCYPDSFVKLLTASTAFDTARQQNSDNNQRTTPKNRCQRIANAKKVHVHTIHQNYQRQIRRKYQRCTERTPHKRRHHRWMHRMQRQWDDDSRDRLANNRGICAHYSPYCVVTGTH